MNEPTPAIARRASYRDVLDAPANMVAELAHGALYLHPRPAMRHARASSKLGGRLDGPFDEGVGGPGGWWIVDEPELHLGAEVLVPDLAGWRRTRMTTYPDTSSTGIVPDWICEVLSPGTRTFDLTLKRDLYGTHGVAHLWLVDPEARTLEVFGLRDGVWTLLAALADDAEVRAAPFDAVGFPLGTLWPD